ncbi:aspartyl protease family protein [Marchantia polymorpha subsp. ruderalis]|uniref:Peptidase A1 domain-containing protein n=2 Tax=Marchantia polymorpha TaxID=3197 RepID=A0AAF6BY56_MARPO|nr:hypothetical protein MARPO_0316s0004 [Marchantia polymorpha]BBN16940.1 hypothetical protein Mp_7g10610 [Marchantia polymorpha subsp. ruderalis]|eukprot:PTQ26843.1 hypothetical protein MARPO_0316s0004 [Marchantia polymorpha]
MGHLTRLSRRPVFQFMLVVTFSWSVLARCDETRPCTEEFRSLPGIPLQSLSSARQDCGPVDALRATQQRTGKSGFDGRTVTARRLGEGLGFAGREGIRLTMAHRSVHPSEPFVHPREALQRLLARDQVRVRRFSREAESSSSRPANELVRAPERDTFPDITHPGGKKRPNTTTATKPTSTTEENVYNFQSTVGSGVHLGSGEYFMDFYVGTPAKAISVIIDTGSDLTWVQCDPCNLCYHQQGPFFSPNGSSSYQGLHCNSNSCVSAGGFGEDAEGGCNADKPGVCKYFYYYGDSSNTTGDYALETVTFNVSGGAPLQIEQILFGCGHSNIGLFQGSGGLLGLGQGAISFVSQIGDLFKNRFSYCLVDRDNPLKVKSPLVFGEDTVYAKLEDQMQWTPFLKNTPTDTFYYINITGVSVGGESLPIPDSVWAIDAQGYGGSIIDSGTTLTYFKQEAYDLISKKFQELITYPSVSSVPVLEICYNVSGVENPDFPAFSVRFEGDAVMELPFQNYFIRADPEDEVYCLALLSVGPKNINIVGNFQQQNFHVVYDRGNSRLGFAPVDCSSAL